MGLLFTYCSKSYLTTYAHTSKMSSRTLLLIPTRLLCYEYLSTQSKNINQRSCSMDGKSCLLPREWVKSETKTKLIYGEFLNVHDLGILHREFILLSVYNMVLGVTLCACRVVFQCGSTMNRSILLLPLLQAGNVVF